MQHNWTVFNEETIFESLLELKVETREHRKPIWSQFFSYYKEKLPKLSDARRVVATIVLVYAIDIKVLCVEGLQQFISMMVNALKLEIPENIIYRDHCRAYKLLDIYTRRNKLEFFKGGIKCWIAQPGEIYAVRKKDPESKKKPKLKVVDGNQYVALK